MMTLIQFLTIHLLLIVRGGGGNAGGSGSSGGSGTTPTLNTPTVNPTSVSLVETQTLTLTASASLATGSGTLTYQWYKGSAAISGATGATYTKANVTTSDTGSYKVRVGVQGNSSVTKDSSTVTVTVQAGPKVSIATQPAATTKVDTGTSVTLTVAAASGSNGTLSYQWYKDGSAISKAKSASYTFTASNTSYGTYYVIITATVGSVTATAQSNNAVVAKKDAVTSATPSITSQQPPISKTVYVGDTCELSVTVATPSDGGTLSYQWYKGGSPISGATSASYSVPTTAPATDDQYYVIVTNTVSGGTPSTATSKTVKVTVYENPTSPNVTITGVPTGTIYVGDTVTLTANVTNANGTVTYQWKKGGTAISDATAKTYTVPTSAAGSATYTVTVTNTKNDKAAEPVTATSVTVTVVARPQNKVTLTCTCDVGNGNAIYFVGGFDESANWTKAVHGSYNTTTNKWECEVTYTGTGFEWKVMKGTYNTPGKIVTVKDSGLYWSKQPTDNKYPTTSSLDHSGITFEEKAAITVTMVSITLSTSSDKWMWDANPVIAAWVFGSSEGDKWIVAERGGTTDSVTLSVPDDATGFKCVRFAPNTTEFGWAGTTGYWNQISEDVTITPKTVTSYSF